MSYSSPQNKMVAGIQNQSGAALITCLLFLMIMTLLGVSSMSSSTMEEKMAGNTRNKHLSFHSAESAIRVAEDWVEDSPLIKGIVADGTDRYYDKPTAGSAHIWNDNSSTWEAVSISGSDAARNPEYLVENFSETTIDINCASDLPAGSGLCFLDVFRVTSRGFGKNELNPSIVQTTYNKPQ